MSSEHETNPDELDHGEVLARASGHPGPGVLELFRQAFHLPIGSHAKPPEGTKVNPIEFMRDFREAVHFKELDKGLVVAADPIGLIRVLPDGKEEIYLEKLERERKKGQNESVSYGTGKIGNHDVVVVTFNWEFMGGTSGVVAGEKILRAADLAIDKNLPLIMIGDSGGQRQQEAVPALRVMPQTVFALNAFKEKTRQPLIFVTVANMWGGLTASAEPMGDVAIGISNADMGFAGPAVMEKVEGKRPPLGSQSVETRFKTNRTIHVILKNLPDLLHYLERNLDVVGKIGQSAGKSSKLKEISCLYFEKEPVGPYMPSRPLIQIRSHPRSKVPTMHSEIVNPKSVWDQHLVLSSDPRRPDTLYILQHAFDGLTPLFSGRIEENGQIRNLRFPAIIAALAYVNDPRLEETLVRMVIGHQPSYLRLSDGRIAKEHASPTASDYRYQRYMFSFAERLRLQIVTFGDTFGAEATLANDTAAQYREISECQQDQMNHPFFISSYLLGMGGSGGHIGTVSVADYIAMLSGAQEYVAEPRSAAAIIYKNPTLEDIIRTAEGMRPTAESLLALGLIDHIIREPRGGAQNNPLALVRALRENIIGTELEFGNWSPGEIKARREHRMRNSRPIPLHTLT